MSNEHSDVCETCNQPLPSDSPYRGTVPFEEIDTDNPFSVVRGKAQMAWAWLQANTPAPVSWMFKSIGWILVGTAVVSSGLVAGYFVVRYLMWALIVMLGKWLLDRIGRGIPRVSDGMAISLPHTDFGLWEIGMLGIVGVVILAFLGKLITNSIRNRTK